MSPDGVGCAEQQPSTIEMSQLFISKAFLLLYNRQSNDNNINRNDNWTKNIKDFS